MVINSAMGTASHTPLSPNTMGRVNRNRTNSTKVLMEEIIADAFPSDNAVKNAEANILIPLNKKLHANMENPLRAMEKTGVASSAKNLTSPVANRMDKKNIAADTPTTKKIQILKIFLSLSLFPNP